MSDMQPNSWNVHNVHRSAVQVSPNSGRMAEQRQVGSFDVCQVGSFDVFQVG